MAFAIVRAVECKGLSFFLTYLLAISSLLSRLIGIARNHELASVFGAGELSDAYFAAFQVPDTLYRLFIFGAISASFVPMFLALRKKDQEKAWEFTSGLLNILLLLIFLVSIILFFWSEKISSFLYPEFSGSQISLTSGLLRVMLISPLLFTISSVLSGIQNAFRTFWGFALAPIVYNAGILFGIEFLAPSYGIYGVAYGVVIGAVFHALVQLIPCIRLGFHWKPVLSLGSELKTLLLISFPRILTMSGAQLIFFSEGIIASALLPGDLTALRYAQDIQSFPIGIVGVSIAISSFSVFSHFILDEKIPEMASYLRDKIEHLMILLLPAMVGLYLLREPLIALTLRSGGFGPHETMLTGEILQYLCIGIIFSALIAILSRVFFAFHDTLSPLLIMIGTVGLNVFLAILLSRSMGVAGIALASSITAVISSSLMLLIIKRKHLGAHAIIPKKTTILFITATGIMAACLELLLPQFSWSTHWGVILAETMALTAIGAGIYFAVLLLTMKSKTLELLKTLGH